MTEVNNEVLMTEKDANRFLNIYKQADEKGKRLIEMATQIADMYKDFPGDQEAAQGTLQGNQRKEDSDE